MANEMALSEVIYEELSKDITEQRLKCGQPLTLKMLKDRFNVSHTPIREALSRLVSDGLVEYTTNKGMRVRHFDDNDIKQIFEFSAELEAIAVKFCSYSFLRAPMLNELKECIEAETEAIEAKDFDKWASYAGTIHDIFFNYCGNDYLRSAAAKLGARMNILNNFYANAEKATTIYNRHKKIYEAVAGNDYELAANLVREHLQYSMLDTLQNFHSDNK